MPASPKQLTGAEPGEVCHRLVELRDVMPTLLELAEQPCPTSVDGSSMLLAARDSNAKIRDFLHGEHTLGIHSNHFIVTETDKYIWYSRTGVEQYFDLSTYRKECHNLIDKPSCQKRITDLRAILADELKNREEGYSDGSTLFPGKEPVTIMKKEPL